MSEKEIPKVEEKKTFWDKIDYDKVFNVSVVVGVALVSYVMYAYREHILIILLIGSLGFLPIGFLFGWFLLDPYKRAKALRFLTKKNYGIINLVSKGKNIISMVKDFDNSVVVIKDRLLLLKKNRVYRMTKENKSTEVIKPENIFYLDGVPVLFFDIDGMKPLSFFKEEDTSDPQDVGATLLGWLNNQYAKALFFKRTMQIAGGILLVLVAVAVYFGYTNYTMLHDQILPLLKTIKAKQTAIVITNSTIGG